VGSATRRRDPSHPCFTVAQALAQGARRFIGRHRGEQVEIIERISGFRGLLHLQHIIRPHHTPVLAHRALGVEIIDRQFLHLGNDLGRVGRAGCRNRLEEGALSAEDVRKTCENVRRRI